MKNLLIILGMLCLSFGAIAQDTDGDGLTDAEETNVYNTDPNNFDTDNDGLSDGFEVENADAADPGSAVAGFDPLVADVDGDGLLDGQETAEGGNSILDQVTNPDNLSPFKADSDGDGLTDGEEFNNQNQPTDPTVSDTDGDQLSDGDEIALGTDPLDPDSDNDGLTDGAEADATVGIGTDPLNPDSDGDGINDKDEVDNGTDPLKSDSDDDGLNDFDEIEIYGSLPDNSDSDGDGLSDGDEVLVHLTNPVVADSDGDGCTDGQEIAVGNSPTDDTQSQASFYPDTDGDGFGDANATATTACEAPESFVQNNTDCNDNNASINPNRVWYADTDNDGFGDENNTTQSCTQPNGFIAEAGDCDDQDADVFPGAPAKADGKDNNCDGTIDRIDQTVTFEAITNKVFTDSTFVLSASSSIDTLKVSYTTTGPITVSNDTVTITGTGTSSITASHPGNNFYNPSNSITREFTIAKGDQTVTFPDVADAVFSQQTITLNASSNTGLPISYTVTGPGSLDGNMLSVTGAGEITINAVQPGNDNFNASNTITQTISIAKGNQNITLVNAEEFVDATYAAQSYTLDIETSSGLTPTVTVSGPANYTSETQTLTVTDAGTINLEISQGGNENYNAATPVTLEFTISPRTQTINFAAIAAQDFDAGFLVLEASSSENLPITYTVDGPGTISNDTLFFENAGSISITASQEGSIGIAAAEAITNTFCINPNRPGITVSEPNEDNEIYLISSATTGNIWTINGSTSAITNDSLLITEPGDYTVTVEVEVDGCSSPISLEATLSFDGGVTGIDEYLNNGELKVYPNPSTAYINLSLSQLLFPDQPLISLYDMQGKLLQQELPVLIEGQWQIQFTTSHFDNGIYVYQINNNNKVVSGKFIKR